ncbi:MAG: hypothetical protein N2378_17470 [Chloroflexaceae bacterium]|nr:hypothetical protein [Chloroflexaceae bacterium]
MPHRSIALPLSLVVVFAGLMLALLAGALPATPLITTAQNSSCPYPDPSSCQSSQQTDPYPGGTSTSTPTPAAQSQATPTATPTTSTTIATATPTPTVRLQTATVIVTPAPTRTRPPAPTGPTPTPTNALPAGIETLVCVPGTTITLTGSGPPGTALLAYFNDRPVGGGFSRADGAFSIDLVIGPERPGQYLVEVRKRDGRERVSQWGCDVPGATPTPTLVAPSPTGSDQGLP